MSAKLLAQIGNPDVVVAMSQVGVAMIMMIMIMVAMSQLGVMMIML